MHRIDGYGSTPDSLFTEGDPAQEIPPTYVTDDWANAVQEEIAGTVEAAGLTLVKAENTQLRRAVGELGRVINVRAHGIPGDGVTDVIDGLDDLVAYAQTFSFRPLLWFPAAEGYRVTSGLVIPPGIDVQMDGPLIYGGAANETALRIGAAGQVNIDLRARVNVTREAQSDWTNEACIGVEIFNATHGWIDVLQATKFTIGAAFVGSDEGLQYCLTRLFNVGHNKVGVDLTTETPAGGSYGWVNENKFYGGRFWCGAGVGTGLARYGIRVTSRDGTYLLNNTNLFHGPSFELNAAAAGAAELRAIDVVHGMLNVFLHCRNENGGGKLGRTANTAQRNRFHTSYGACDVEDVGSYPSSITEAEATAVESRGTVVFASGALHKAAGYYNATDYVHVPRLHVASGSNGSVYRGLDGFSALLNAAYLTTTRGLGLFVDTRTAKRFVVRKDVEAGYGGRVAIQCFDATGTLLTSAGAGHPYVQGHSALTYSWNGTDWGGSYRSGTDYDGDGYFVVGADVAWIRLLLIAGSSALRLRSFSLLSVEGKQAGTWSGYEEVVPGAHLATAVPVKGNWKDDGYTLYHAAPAVGATPKWVVTTPGYPVKGAWAQDVVTAIGDQVSNGGNIYVAATAGTTGASAPTHGSGDASDGAVTWTFVATSAAAVFTAAAVL